MSNPPSNDNLQNPILVKLVQDSPGAMAAADPGPTPTADEPVDLPSGTQVGGDAAKKRQDGFYKAWERFTKKKREGGKPTTSEHDVEGRPGRPVETGNGGAMVRSQGAARSYDEAVANCKAKVQAIRQECRRLNQKYYDRAFDLPSANTLVSLGAAEEPTSFQGLSGVGSVKRIDKIFDDPEFFEDGATADDVRQGMTGDCWFLAAITALSGKSELLNRVCVDRDEKVGVYGFVFFRDGEWISEVIDDRLCLQSGDDERAAYQTEFLLRVTGEKDIRKTPISLMTYGKDYGLQFLPKEFRESLRKGSNALYFASCRTSNETWLPLLEKAYAKAHGDYQAIEGGFPGEGIEDLTGGVATYIQTESVLDKEQLWQELLLVNDKFLFGCGSREGRDSDPSDEEGFVRGHAYTVLEAREIEIPKQADKKDKKKKKKSGDAKKEEKDGKEGAKEDDKPETEKVRLLKLHNPWGKQEWNGAWSDGSKEWTPKVMEQLNHTFGDDGLFWISFSDFLQFYPEIDRIRLIGSEWTVSQQWTSVRVPWTAEYNDTSFKLTVAKDTPAVIVLSQPDDRYFRGLQGRYRYELHFRLYREDEDPYLLRSMEDSGSDRSCSAELTLAKGTYFVRVKVTARRSDWMPTHEEVIRAYRDERRQKLLSVGRSYDEAHSKGLLGDAEREVLVGGKREIKEKELKKLKEEREDTRAQRLRKKMRDRRVRNEEKRKKEEKIKKKKAELEIKKKEKEAEKARKKAVADEEKAKQEAEKAKDEKENVSSEDKQAETGAEGPKINNLEDVPHKKHDEASKAEGEKSEAGETKLETKKAEPKADSEEKKSSEASDQKAPEAKDTSSTSTESIGKLTPSSTMSESKADEMSTNKGEAKSDEATQTDKKAEADSVTQTEKAGADGITQTEKKESSEGTQTNDKPPAKEASSDKKVEIAEPEKETTGTTKDGPSADEKAPSTPNMGEDDAAKEDDPAEKIDSNDKADDSAKTPEDAECESEEDPDVSDISSVQSDDFPWDDTMDGPVQSDPDDVDYDEDSDTDEDDEEAKKDDLYADDPWNALCVLGLRVCSLEDGVAIAVCNDALAGGMRGERPRFGRAKSVF